MKLELGLIYTVLKTDKTTITFKFVGGEPPCGLVNEQRISLVEIFSGGYLAYWEVEN